MDPRLLLLRLPARESHVAVGLAVRARAGLVDLAGVDAVVIDLLLPALARALAEVAPVAGRSLAGRDDVGRESTALDG